MLERWCRSFSMTLNTPIGVGCPGTPVDTGPCATRSPLANSVTRWLPIDTTICNGPFGSSPKPTSFCGSGFVLRVDERARRGAVVPNVPVYP